MSTILGRYLQELGRNSKKLNSFYRELLDECKRGRSFDRYFIPTLLVLYPILWCYDAVDSVPRVLRSQRV